MPIFQDLTISSGLFVLLTITFVTVALFPAIRRDLNYRFRPASMIAALRDSLEGLDPIRERENWAHANYALGHALVRRADIASLEEADECLKQALSVFTEDHDPKLWEAIQLNRIHAISALALRDVGVARYLQLFEIYGELQASGHTHYTPAGANKIGIANAMIMLGWRQGDPETLKKSLVVLREITMDSELIGAIQDEARDSLGSALFFLGRLESSVAYLEEAMTLARAALQRGKWKLGSIWPRRHRTDLGSALASLGELKNEVPLVNEAEKILRSALTRRLKKYDPMYWIAAQDELGHALRLRGGMTGSLSDLQDAVMACEAALDALQQDNIPFFWAETMDDLGLALRELGEREGDRDKLARAADAHRDAARMFDKFGNKLLAGRARRNFALAKKSLIQP